MAGLFTVLGKIAEHIFSPAQRRRLQIGKLEERQKWIKDNWKDSYSAEYDNNEHKLIRLYKESASA